MRIPLVGLSVLLSFFIIAPAQARVIERPQAKQSSSAPKTTPKGSVALPMAGLDEVKEIGKLVDEAEAILYGGDNVLTVQLLRHANDRAKRLAERSTGKTRTAAQDLGRRINRLETVLIEREQSLQRVTRRTLRNNVREAAAIRQRQRRATSSELTEPFESDPFGVSVLYPGSWDADITAETDGDLTLVAMFLSPVPYGDTVRENINLLVEDTTRNPLTLEEYSKLAVEKAKEVLTNFRMLESGNARLAARPAYRIVYTATFNGRLLKFVQIWTMRSAEVHVWTFTDAADTFDTNVWIFERMMETLQIRDKRYDQR